MGSGSMHTDTTRSRPQVAARTGLIVRTRGRPVAMLGVDGGCGGTSTTHSDIELVVFVVVNAHLGEASRSLDFAQGYESSEAELLGIRLCTHTAVGRDGTPQSLDGWDRRGADHDSR